MVRTAIVRVNEDRGTRDSMIRTLNSPDEIVAAQRALREEVYRGLGSSPVRSAFLVGVIPSKSRGILRPDYGATSTQIGPRQPNAMARTAHTSGTRLVSKTRRTPTGSRSHSKQIRHSMGLIGGWPVRSVLKKIPVSFCSYIGVGSLSVRAYRVRSFGGSLTAEPRPYSTRGRWNASLSSVFSETGRSSLGSVTLPTRSRRSKT